MVCFFYLLLSELHDVLSSSVPTSAEALKEQMKSKQQASKA